MYSSIFSTWIWKVVFSRFELSTVVLPCHTLTLVSIYATVLPDVLLSFLWNANSYFKVQACPNGNRKPQIILTLNNFNWKPCYSSEPVTLYLFHQICSFLLCIKMLPRCHIFNYLHCSVATLTYGSNLELTAEHLFLSSTCNTICYFNEQQPTLLTLTFILSLLYQSPYFNQIYFLTCM